MIPDIQAVLSGERWWCVVEGDSLLTLREMPSESVDSIVCDPPYGLGDPPHLPSLLRDWLATGYHEVSGRGFMGQKWDAFVPQPVLWAECLRVLKPGGHLIAFAGTRTQHMMALGIQFAGFELRDLIGWIYGCLDEETQVATPDGAVPYNKTKAGDLVLCYDSDNEEYSFQPILEVVEYEYNDTAYRLVGDFGEQVVSRNHRVLVEQGGVRSFQFAEALQSEASVPVLESLPALLQAVRDAEQDTGNAKQDVQQGVRKGGAGAAQECAYASLREKGKNGRLRGMWQCDVEAERVASPDIEANVQQRVQRGASWRGVGQACAQGTRALDGAVEAVAQTEDDGAEQPGVEGRCHSSQQERHLLHAADQVRQVPGEHDLNGTPRRLRDGASDSCCACDGSIAPALGGRASCESRRDGQQGGKPDAVQHERATQGVRAWGGDKASVVRVLPFHYVGKVWCLRVPTGAFVAVRNGVAFPTGNSGFPKSLDVSKAIDKAAGAEREVVGKSARHVSGKTEQRTAGLNGSSTFQESIGMGGTITAPATPAARQWHGWGTALKPAIEPITLARKPLRGTVAANVQTYGTGAINVDGCRVATEGARRKLDATVVTRSMFGAMGGSRADGETTEGRFPANLIHDGSEEVLAVFPDSDPHFSDTPIRATGLGVGSSGSGGTRERRPKDAGSAARFFYSPKASKADREEGLDAFPAETVTDGRETPNNTPRQRGTTERRNTHPTVKPTELMRYLCRLITPPGGVVLDPFAGSGSTGKAARLEGFRFIGIDLDEKYCAIARARITAAGEPSR